jgi:hypothetical protein
MSQSVATIVRPAQAPRVSPAQAYVAPGQRSRPPVVLNWGRNGSGKTMSGSYSQTITFYMDQQVVEKSSSSP